MSSCNRCTSQFFAFVVLSGVGENGESRGLDTNHSLLFHRSSAACNVIFFARLWCCCPFHECSKPSAHPCSVRDVILSYFRLLFVSLEPSFT